MAPKLKHTPGPWFSNGGFIRTGTVPIACVGNDNQTANARLMAAAPELLAAVLAVLDEDSGLARTRILREAVEMATGFTFQGFNTLVDEFGREVEFDLPPYD